MNVFFIGKSIKKTEFIGSTRGVLFSFLPQLSGDAIKQEVLLKGHSVNSPRGNNTLYFSLGVSFKGQPHNCPT